MTVTTSRTAADAARALQCEFRAGDKREHTALSASVQLPSIALVPDGTQTQGCLGHSRAERAEHWKLLEQTLQLTTGKSDGWVLNH